MGICLSARIKAETPSQTEVGVTNSNNSSTDNTSLSPTSSSSNTDKPSSSSSSSTPLTQLSEGEILNFPNLKNFTYSELKSATKNFRSDYVLGEGGFGSVYKGWIDQQSLTATKPGSGMIVAVKKLNPESYQGHREWLAEVNFLGQLSHPNLVKLIGYCLEDEHRLLVYEFLPKGSLENHLFRRGTYYQPISWDLRLKVALDAAKGLAFLHSSDVKVIYRDLKSSNVLLDSQYNAKLSDFGLAKDGPTGDKSHVSTRVIGTHGYAAPEYIATGHLTSKSDVYSFGVVLLELLSGRRAIDKNRPTGQHNLVDWARPYLVNRRKILHILDNRIQRQYRLEAADRVAAMAFRCLSVESKFRPSMGEVVREIERVMGRKESGGDDGGEVGSRKRSGGDDSGRAGSSTTGGGGGVLYPRPSDSFLYA